MARKEQKERDNKVAVLQPMTEDEALETAQKDSPANEDMQEVNTVSAKVDHWVLPQDNGTDDIKSPTTMEGFRSTSQELKVLIRGIVEDGATYSKKEIVFFLNKNASKAYSEACLINVLRNMVNDGTLMQLERGSYTRGSGSFKSRLYKYLSTTRNGLSKACTLTASEVEEADFEVIKHIKELEQIMDCLLAELEVSAVG